MEVIGVTDDLFDFFGLPRELRDIIYDHLLLSQADAIHICPNNFRYKLRYIPTVNCLLVSQSFQHELLERVPLISEVIFEDALAEVQEYLRPKLHPALNRIGRAHLELYASCSLRSHTHGKKTCQAEQETITHAERLKYLIDQIPSLQAVTVNLHLHDNQIMEECIRIILANHAVLSGITKVAKLDVYTAPTVVTQEEPEDWDYGGSKKLLSMWKYGMAEMMLIDHTRIAAGDGQKAPSQGGIL